VSDRLRLFVGLDLPVEVRESLAGWCDRVAPEGVRRVPAGNLHVTLAFLGSRSWPDVDAVAELLPRLPGDIGTLETGGALWLPPRRPGVLTVALRDSLDLATLHASTVAALSFAIDFEPEARPFRPHVTVGRVRRGTRVAPSVDPPALAFSPEALTLYRSHTRAAGTRYEALARRMLLDSGRNAPHRPS